MKTNKHKRIKLISEYKGNIPTESLSNSITRQILIIRTEIIGPEYTTMRVFHNETIKAMDKILNKLFDGQTVELRLPNGIYLNIPKEEIDNFEKKIIYIISKKLGIEIEKQ